MSNEFLLAAMLVAPFMAFIPAFTPPEWWFSLHDNSHSARTVNQILWLEMRLGNWYASDGVQEATRG